MMAGTALREPELATRLPQGQQALARADILSAYVKRDTPAFSFAATGRSNGVESTVQTQDDAPQKSNGILVHFPEYKPLEYNPSESMWALQEWDGHVVDVGPVFFTAMLAPVSGPAGIETEVFEYPLDALTPRDRKNISTGSIFRLSAGYSRKKTGQVRQAMEVYFRPKGLDIGGGWKEIAQEIDDLFQGSAIPSPAPDDAAVR